MFYQIEYENTTRTIESACFAGLAREGERREYVGGEEGDVLNVIYVDEEDSVCQSWMNYLENMPLFNANASFYEKYIDDLGYSCLCAEVSSEVNPHHMLFLLGLARYPSFNSLSYCLFLSLVKDGVHPDVALYTAMYSLKRGDDVIPYQGVAEYALTSEQYVSIDNMRNFVENIVNNNNIPEYIDKEGTSYRKWMTYSRDGVNPFCGWVASYKEVAETTYERLERTNINWAKQLNTAQPYTEVVKYLLHLQKQFNLREI